MTGATADTGTLAASALDWLYSYGWCHGPAGDAQAFRLLHQLTGEARWLALQDRCWRTVVESGLPRRLRPGFWDNSGRCCGTARVLALACDAAAGRRNGLEFGAVLVADLAARATVDPAGWSNYEHRQTPSILEPGTAWAMGNAGIVPELLRFARIQTGGDLRYAVTWPDHPQVTDGPLGAHGETTSVSGMLHIPPPATARYAPS